MIWRADSRTIYVVRSDGSWSSYADSWDASQPEGGAETAPSPALRAPKRGFGKIWREKLGGPNAAIGWGVEDERSLSAQFQNFEWAVAFGSDCGAALPILIAGGHWR